MVLNKTYSKIISSSNGNHIGKKILLLRDNNKRVINPSKEDAQKIVKENLKSLTISNPDTAKRALYAVLHFNKDEKPPLKYKEHNCSGVKALHDLMAPVFYDVSINTDNDNKPNIKPVGLATDGTTRKVYRFNLSDIEKYKFSQTDIMKEGVVITGDETGIQTTLDENSLNITIHGPEHYFSIIDKLKHPLQTLKELITPANSKNYQWIKTLSQTPGIEQTIENIPKSQEKSYKFKISEQSLREMSIHDRVKLINKLSSSIPAVDEIKNNLKPLLVLSQAKEMQPGILTLPFKIVNLVHKILSATLALSMFITGHPEPNIKDKLLKPLKIVAEIFNLHNTPEVLSALSPVKKVLYLVSKPLGMLPIIGSIIDAEIVTVLCKHEIKSKMSEYKEKEELIRAETKKSDKNIKKTISQSKKKESWIKNEKNKQLKQIGPQH